MDIGNHAEPRILYVEEESEMLAEREAVLSEEFGMGVQTADGIKAAKRLLESDPFDCVVSSLSLADDTGFNLLSYIRTRHRSLPVILLTNNESESVVQDAFESGATDLFPEEMIEVSYTPLVDRINSVIDAAGDAVEAESTERSEQSAKRAESDTETDPTEVIDNEIVAEIKESEEVDADEIEPEVIEDANIDLEELQQLPRDALLSILTKIIGEQQETEPASNEQRSAAVAAEAETTTDKTEPASVATDKAETTDTASSTAEVDDSIAWEPADDKREKQESAAGYERPSGLSLSPEMTTLVQCGSQDDRKQDARLDLLGLTEPGERNVLLIQYRSLPTDALETIATNANQVTIITIGYSQTVPESVSETVKRININNPNDVTRLGILATGVVKDWAGADAETAVSVDPLDVLFRYKSVEGTFRFLHIFLGKLSNSGSISHFFVNPSASDPRDINTLKPLFDHVLTIDDAGVALEGS